MQAGVGRPTKETGSVALGCETLKCYTLEQNSGQENHRPLVDKVNKEQEAEIGFGKLAAHYWPSFINNFRIRGEADIIKPGLLNQKASQGVQTFLLRAFVRKGKIVRGQTQGRGVLRRVLKRNRLHLTLFRTAEWSAHQIQAISATTKHRIYLFCHQDLDNACKAQGKFCIALFFLLCHNG